MQASHAVAAQSVDRESLESQVKDMYSRVARDPDGEFHFEIINRVSPEELRCKDSLCRRTTGARPRT